MNSLDLALENLDLLSESQHFSLEVRPVPSARHDGDEEKAHERVQT